MELLLLPLLYVILLIEIDSRGLDLTMSSLSLAGDAIGTQEDAGHEAEGAVTLSHDVRLHISIVVLAGPDKPAR